MSGTLRRGVLVTGTDTEVGKTLVTAGIVAALRQAGVPVQPLKPVESGTDENGGVPADAQLLATCAGLPLGATHVVALAEPLAPVVAARRQGVELSMEPLDAAVAAVPDSTALVVEGVGGALVEVAAGVFVADLPTRWGLPVLVVAANRLGVLSHTLLTVQALQQRGAQVLGVVLNTMHPGPPSVAEQTNADELARLLTVPLLATIPWLPEADRRDPRTLGIAVRDVVDPLLIWLR